jgi:mitotic spindle assembly checkpoint protein MAD2
MSSVFGFIFSALAAFLPAFRLSNELGDSRKQFSLLVSYAHSFALVGSILFLLTRMAGAKSEITLRGSTAIVTEFFGYAVNSIIYQRGLYPGESFKRVSKYGVTLFVSTDDGFNAYLTQVMGQLNKWLLANDLEKLVLVIASAVNSETLERWVFNIETTDIENQDPDAPRVTKSDKEIAGEIGAIIRQVTSSVTFLPALEDFCTFDLLVYTRKDAKVPTEWEDSDPKYISNSTEVSLRSFTTKIHKIDTMVSYRAPVE